MIKISTIFAAALISLGLAGPVLAAEAEPITKQHWSFAGLFGTYDQMQLQRGFQVFREVCANCHSARLLAFRNLGEEGGPKFSEGQVKELAAQYIRDGAVGKNERADALHIALATAARVDVLVSWNFKHIVNLRRIHAFNAVNLKHGYPVLEIRNPREVIGDE